MIQGIFYARFLPQEGTKIVAQSPEGCIVATEYTPHMKAPLVDFDIVQEYIIPRKAFFNRFGTVNTPDGKYSILGFPVSIPHERYHRNEFIFNFGLVIEVDVDPIPYERLVRRLAVTFAEMERQNGYLSMEGRVDDGRRPIGSLLEIVKEDLNNYGECMIPVDEANTINMKLFPYHPPPPPVQGWHVPVPKTKLAEIVDPTWDLTLQRIIPYIDGVNDVRRIAWLADVSLPLTQCALQHLLHYDTVLLLDLFFFGSCYAPRPGVHDFIANRAGMVDECAAYVCIASPVPGGTGSGGTNRNMNMNMDLDMTGSPPNLDVPRNTGRAQQSVEEMAGSMTPTAAPRPHHENTPSTGVGRTATLGLAPRPVAVSHYQLIKLMTTFCVGRSVMEWVRLHQEAGFDVLRHIDVRRLVQFGVVKGLLYRVHKYVVSKSYLASLATGRRNGLDQGGKRRGPKRTKPGLSDTIRRGGESTGDGGLEMKMAGRRKNKIRIQDVDNDADENDDGEDGEDGDDGDDGDGLGGNENGVDGDADMDDDDRIRKKMRRYADGCHSFDQIITEQNLTDAEIMQRLKSFDPGDLAIMYR
ncbi:nitrogen permease regulator 2 [Xylariaceae sp. FL0594]|nr:nitrogen permease regulator 2 [Xylariaceae sp. FL0594]